MRTLPLVLAAALAAVGSPAAAAAPTILLEDGGAHVVTFTTPGVYDFTVKESSQQGDLASATLIDHYPNGRIDGVVIDQGNGIQLTTEIRGTCRTSHGATVLKLREKGVGDLGDGQRVLARGVRTSVVRGTGAAATLVSTLRIRTCVTLRKPFSDRMFTKCDRGGGTGERPLGNAGDWTVRLALEQPVVGELLGTGSIATSIRDPEYQRVTQVIAAGSVRDDGTARIALTPLDGGKATVTITARVVAGAGVRHPAVTQILGVKGSLLGQRFNEAF
jgi:hypothetical protein